MPMQKPLKTLAFSFAVATSLLGQAIAQDTPANTAAKPAQSTSSQSTTKAPATKKTTPGTKPSTAAGTALTTQKAKNSYALGMSIGSGLKRQGIATVVDPATVARGMRDAMAGSKTALTDDEAKAAMQQLRGEVEKMQEAKAHEAGASARKEGEAFLASNKSKDGVKTLPDGLQYKVVTEGSGPKPAATDTVTVNYRGTLINGKEFDSSYKRGQPASFPVNGVIKGWTEALQLMPVGSKWQIYIPADLAYGDRGAGGDIGPGETLVFDVELISIGEKK